MMSTTAPTPPTTQRARDAIAHREMKSSRSVDDRRDRGRGIDRGVPQRPARSRSPDRERSDRKAHPRDRRTSHDSSRPRERSRDRRRKDSRSPVASSRDAVRERNRGRELLETRASDRRESTHYSESSHKRRKSRSPSLTSRSHHKKSRRRSRSPSRAERPSSRSDKTRRAYSPLPQRRRSPERNRDRSYAHAETAPRSHRDTGISDRRGRSVEARRDRSEHRRAISPQPQRGSSRRKRSPLPSPARPFRDYTDQRVRSVVSASYKEDTKRARSPEIDRYEARNRSSRQTSPWTSKDQRSRAREGRSQSPRREKGRRDSREEYRPTPSRSNKKSRQSSFSGASGANGVEVKTGKMAGRGFFPHHGTLGPNPTQQMQAAFPHKPQFNQNHDPRQYSQSPHSNMTPNSYQGSPQPQSPYNAGRGNYQQSYSPHHQYPQQQIMNNFSPHGQHGNFYQSQSPPYQTPTGPMHQNFRGNQRGNYRGNNFIARGGRGNYAGRGTFQNPQWIAPGLAGRGSGTFAHSGNVTPVQMSPPQQFPPQSNAQVNTPQHNTSQSTPQQGTPQNGNSSTPQGNNSQNVPEDEDAEDLFRPSKDLQVEDSSTKVRDDEQMPPPPSRAPPTGPQSQQSSSKFSFAFKGAAAKTPAIPLKPEVASKLNVTSTKPSAPDRPTGPRGSIPLGPGSHAANLHIPTAPASARPRNEFRTPQPPQTRKVKKIMQRLKPKPQLPADFKASDSVYFRKPGNESVVGSGTYGKVFKGIHVYTKGLVALKKIRMEGEKDGFPVTAVREIKLLQSLKHANIVNLQEVMVEKNDCFMVFEYMSHDLTGLLNHPNFKLEPYHKKHLAKQLFEGLEYLHHKGVLHRDIKAANILVSSDGQLKLADFGLARFYAKRRQLDYTNRVITIWYRSPELLLGETQYGAEVDIWSAACVLVEIFTRHAIFPGDGGEISQLEKIYAILGTPSKTDWPGLVDMAWFELMRPSAKRPNVFAKAYKERVTPAAYDLLEAMFQYDPKKRPSASDVLEHPYFTTEEPKPRQVIELAKVEGDWHEFESKALRKENERKDREVRKAAEKEKARDKKRGTESHESERDAKRLQMGPPAVPIKKEDGVPIASKYE